VLDIDSRHHNQQSAAASPSLTHSILARRRAIGGERMELGEEHNVDDAAREIAALLATGVSAVCQTPARPDGAAALPSTKGLDNTGEPSPHVLTFDRPERPQKGVSTGMRKEKKLPGDIGFARDSARRSCRRCTRRCSARSTQLRIASTCGGRSPGTCRRAKEGGLPESVRQYAIAIARGAELRVRIAENLSRRQTAIPLEQSVTTAVVANAGCPAAHAGGA